MRNLKYRLVDANYNAETGLSVATITTSLGDFSNVAKVNPEENPKYVNQWVGCEIAEARAYILYLNEEVRLAKERYLTLGNLYQNLTKSTPRKNEGDSNGYNAALNTIFKNYKYAENEYISIRKFRDDVKDYENNIAERRAKMKDSLYEKLEKKNQVNNS